MPIYFISCYDFSVAPGAPRLKRAERSADTVGYTFLDTRFSERFKKNRAVSYTQIYAGCGLAGSSQASEIMEHQTKPPGTGIQKMCSLCNCLSNRPRFFPMDRNRTATYNRTAVGIHVRGRRRMLRLTQAEVRRRLMWWQSFMLLVVVALGVSLATRVCHVVYPHSVHVQASASEGMRQHMDRDATPWVAPVPSFTFLETASFYPKFAPAGPPLPATLFDESLSNRPPPSSASLA